MNRRTVALGAGLVAPIVALVTILGATALDPGFGWLDSALSHTGELPEDRSLSLSLLVDRPSFPVFNGGLLLTGLAGLPFAWALYVDGDNRLEQAGAALFALALLLLSGVGVFYLPLPLHGPVAIGHFLAATAFFVVYGIGAFLAGRRRFGAATAALGPLHLAGWILWAIVLASGPAPGIAIPETYGAFLFGGWSFAVAYWSITAIGPDDARIDL